MTALILSLFLACGGTAVQECAQAADDVTCDGCCTEYGYNLYTYSAVAEDRCLCRQPAEEAFIDACNQGGDCVSCCEDAGYGDGFVDEYDVCVCTPE